jgi:DNA-binding MarR family transcriptional regulator
VEVFQDPADRRARLVRCTPRGEEVRRVARTVVAAVEDTWRAQVGEDRYAIFRDVLRELVDGAPADASRRGPRVPLS